MYVNVEMDKYCQSISFMSFDTFREYPSDCDLKYVINHLDNFVKTIVDIYSIIHPGLKHLFNEPRASDPPSLNQWIKRVISEMEKLQPGKTLTLGRHYNSTKQHMRH